MRHTHMLWQGQEIVENYDVPDSGPARIGTLRPVRWERFYDPVGTSMNRLTRRLVALRRDEAVFRRGGYYFYNDWDHHQWRGLLLFSRQYANEWALVALNFSAFDHQVEFAFPSPGDYHEQLYDHPEDRLLGATTGSTLTLRIPRHYGRVWLRR